MINDERMPPMPADIAAEWVVLEEQNRIARENAARAQYWAARERGLDPKSAEAEVRDLQDLSDRALADAGTATRRPRADDLDEMADSFGEDVSGFSGRRERHRDRRDDGEGVIMFAAPGRFSRALSSGGSWLRAVGISLALGGVTFVAIVTGLHWIFDTDSWLTWPTGLVGGWLAAGVFAGVLHSASREVREWIRVGGAKPIRFR